MLCSGTLLSISKEEGPTVYFPKESRGHKDELNHHRTFYFPKVSRGQKDELNHCTVDFLYSTPVQVTIFREIARTQKVL